MQTFLPSPSFAKTAQILDYRRLGNQRVEAWRILMALRGESNGWRNHPATLQWFGHEDWLCKYAIAICDNWISRGYRDSMRSRFVDVSCVLPKTPPPSWLGRLDYHASHRSNLLRKDYAFYSSYGWSEPAYLPYVWPSRAA